MPKATGTGALWGLACIVSGCPDAVRIPRPRGVCRQSSPLSRACGSDAGPRVRGVDVSKYQGAIKWPEVSAAGIGVGFARISDGTANPDAYFTANWQGMKAQGMVRGAYQYFRASVDPTAQANLVMASLQRAGGLDAADLPVVMDIETADGQAEATIESNMRTWLSAVSAHTLRTPIIYTSAGTYPVKSAAFAAYPLWVADYGATCPSMPTGWSRWMFWQTSSSGSVNGITGAVDLDEFDGTLGDLSASRTDAGMRAVPDGGAGAAGPSALEDASGAPPAIDASAPSLPRRAPRTTRARPWEARGAARRPPTRRRRPAALEAGSGAMRDLAPSAMLRGAASRAVVDERGR